MSTAGTTLQQPPGGDARRDRRGAGSRWPRKAFIRSDFGAAGSMRELGETIGRGEPLTLPNHVPFTLQRRERSNEATILRIYRGIVPEAEAGRPITPAAEWLLDNHHLVAESILEVRRDLPPRFYRELPALTLADGAVVPRALALVWMYVAETDSQFRQSTLDEIVEGFQQHQSLSIGELWAIPSLVRFLLIENMRRVAVQVARTHAMRASANELADALAELEPGAPLDPLLDHRADLCAERAFSAQLLYRLRGGSEVGARALEWLEHRLADIGTTASNLIVEEQNSLSSGNVLAGNIIRSLRAINDVDWLAWFEQHSQVDAALRHATDFAALDKRTRSKYRERIEMLARRSGATETEVTHAAISLAAQPDDEAVRLGGESAGNVGAYLIGACRPLLEHRIGFRGKVGERFRRSYRRLGHLGILVPITLLTLAGLAAAAVLMVRADISTPLVVLLLVLLAFPASEAASNLFHTLVSLRVVPMHLAGYAYTDGVPPESATLVVIPCLLSDRDTVDELVGNLEVHYLANPEGALSFALLSDWPDARTEETDADRELLEYARRQVARLCDRYAHTGRRFHLLHRKRLWNAREDRWMGWERKRGKLHELNLLLRGDKDTGFLPPDDPLPEDIRYVITLDADTRLPRDAAAELVGKIAHPLNSAAVDPRTGRVVTGHGIMQPRITPSLTTGSEASAFQRTFSAHRGMDPYVFAVSDTYQDLVDEGSFTGKGIYDVDAFEAALEGRIPENAVLSHDLLEGSYARSALVTDVQFVEDFPTRYDVDVSRQHRWARGDWQLLPYILRPGAGVPMLGRFKMADNLRRSLVPVLWVLASLVGWCTLTPGLAAGWQAMLVLSLVLSPLVLILDGVRRQVGVGLKSHLLAFGRDILNALAQAVLRLVFLAHTATVMLDAIVRTLYRLLVSHRHMLEWRTAAAAASGPTGSVEHYYRLMGPSVVLGAAGVGLAALSGTGSWIVALPFGVMWVVAPLVAWWVSRADQSEDLLRVEPSDGRALRVIGRQTWGYYERFVDERNHHLPPDNFQETPQPMVAERTSPTNVGMYLLSIIAARELGWTTIHDAVRRVELTLDTLEAMEKHRGHLYNWYDTTDLRPLEPRYISAVDSGNLAGHLVTLASAFRSWAEAPAAHLHADPEGIADVARVVRRQFRAVPDDRRGLRPIRRRIDERLNGFLKMIETIVAEREIISVRSVQLSMIAQEVEQLATDMDQEIGSSRSGLLLRWARALHATCEGHFTDSMVDRRGIESLRTRLLDAGERARSLAFGMDFGFLLDPERQLLSIGYRMDPGELDGSCYDLLASEARLTSLFGIAKGDLPSEHWFRLGRGVVPVRGRAALVSWAGSMFEYLMPPLVMHERPGGLLHQSNRLAVARQQQYAAGLRIPWGISESSLNARDQHLTYQYATFGVPSLGLKRDQGRNAVIAPYATALASQYAPRAAVKNFRRLEDVGALGVYGYYEAVDFTPSRVPEGEQRAVVRNYYAHHQGMSIAAICNVVTHGRLREYFHSDPVIVAAELLLQERAPREAPLVSRATEAVRATATASELQRPAAVRVDQPLVADRSVHLMSNGHYSVMLTATGAGSSRWNDLSVTRWRSDPTEDRWGSFVFLRDADSAEWWSATAEPRAIAGERAWTVFSDERAEFHKTVGDITSVLEVVVAGEADAEGRQLTIENTGEQSRRIEVTSFAELVLSGDATDVAHPLFARMFVRTDIGEAGDVIHATRVKRAPSDPDIHVAHLVVDSSGLTRETQVETDRRAFIGRGRELGTAAAFAPGARLTGSSGYTLDPVMALRRTLRIPPGKKVRVTFWTAAAPSREAAEAAVQHLRRPDAFAVEGRHAWTRSQVQMRYIDLSARETVAFTRAAGALRYPQPEYRVSAPTLRNGLGSQSQLWPLGISGDLPITVIRIDDEPDLRVLGEALRMQEFLRARGVTADLVVLNERPSSYVQHLQQTIEGMVDNARRRMEPAGSAQHIFAVRRDLMEEETYDTLMAVARINLHTRNGSIADQLMRRGRSADPDAADAPMTAPRPTPARHTAAQLATRRGGQLPDPGPVADGDGLEMWNGYGGFDAAAREYVIRLAPGACTPNPWINVIATPTFGFHCSAGGAGFTWSLNSRDHQLTPWSNDPVIDRPGEGFYVHDLVSDEVVTPFASLNGRADRAFEVRHGMGYSVFTGGSGTLEVELTQTVAADDPVKLSRLVVRNGGTTERRLRVYAYAEWVLGNNRALSAPNILSGFDSAVGAVTARNPFSIEHGGRVAFLAADRMPQSFTSSRREFIGANSSVRLPEAVSAGAPLSDSVELTGDPCGALAFDMVVPAGEWRDLTVLLGDAADAAEARAVVSRNRSVTVRSVVEAARAAWDGFLGTLQVQTPDPAANLMLNTWLPYQALACRIRARSAFYQASGAYGFRDQLQDTAAFMLHDPSLARAQVLNAAGRQFPEGDVQHWWLPQTGAGVRTMISDDVVWLAHITSRYIAVTGEVGILDEPVPFIQAPPLEPGQHDAFTLPQPAGETAPLYEHCARALDLAIARTGQHGLPLFLGGDWNDGMNRVGEAGRGESVWLGWFLASALDQFRTFAVRRGDTARADRWADHRRRLGAALEEAGWDGSHYRRGYYDDGAPLGSLTSDECRIDSIAQSWSVLSRAGDPARQRTAMDSVMRELVDPVHGLVRLFTPPLSQTPHEPGYIKAYPPGVRENGGQYTHAATWVVCALAEMGRADEAWRVFCMLNPINHARDAEAAGRYRVEPYVVAADVYGGEGYEGRGGWTWYTGSAGWLYRAGVEWILGIRRRGDRLVVEPVLPPSWPGYRAQLRLDGRVYSIEAGRVGQRITVTVNGAGPDADGTFPIRGTDGAAAGRR